MGDTCTFLFFSFLKKFLFFCLLMTLQITQMDIFLTWWFLIHQWPFLGTQEVNGPLLYSLILTDRFLTSVGSDPRQEKDSQLLTKPALLLALESWLDPGLFCSSKIAFLFTNSQMSHYFLSKTNEDNIYSQKRLVRGYSDFKMRLCTIGVT